MAFDVASSVTNPNALNRVRTNRRGDLDGECYVSNCYLLDVQLDVRRVEMRQETLGWRGCRAGPAEAIRAGRQHVAPRGSVLKSDEASPLRVGLVDGGLLGPLPKSQRSEVRTILDVCVTSE